MSDVKGNNTLGFEMTKVKVGDKVLTRGGEIVTVYNKGVDLNYPCFIEKQGGYIFTVNNFGRKYGKEETFDDVVGFADSQTNVEALAENKGVKHDNGKAQWSYLPVPAVKAVIEVMQYGDIKYPAQDGSNWKRVPNAKKRYYNAAMRHMTSWWDGEQNDPETGYNHLAHACSNLLFLLWFEIKGYSDEKDVK